MTAISRRPTGKSCCICRNAFSAAGLDAEHDDLFAFYNFTLIGANAHHGRAFVLVCEAWIRAANQDDDGVRLQAVKDLGKVFTSLVTKKTRSSGFSMPDCEFVTSKAWNEKLDGEWDESKKCIENVFGVDREGAWVNRGRDGVFKHNTKEEQTTEEITIEDDGKGIFGAERVQRKVAAIQKGQASFEKHRSDHSHDMSHASVFAMSDLMSMLSDSGACLTRCKGFWAS